MTLVQECPRTEPAQPAVDYAAIKQKQQATWASGDFAVIGTTLQIVGESLAEAIDIRAGEKVLDVAVGHHRPARASQHGGQRLARRAGRVSGSGRREALSAAAPRRHMPRCVDHPLRRVPVRRRWRHGVGRCMLRDADARKSARVMTALLGMQKLDIASLERAYEG